MVGLHFILIKRRGYKWEKGIEVLIKPTPRKAVKKKKKKS